MKHDWTPEVVPLGVTLQMAALQIARRRCQPLGWLTPFSKVQRRLDGLPSAGASRFRRVEATNLGDIDIRRHQHEPSWLMSALDAPQRTTEWPSPETARSRPVDATDLRHPDLTMFTCDAAQLVADPTPFRGPLEMAVGHAANAMRVHGEDTAGNALPAPASAVRPAHTGDAAHLPPVYDDDDPRQLGQRHAANAMRSRGDHSADQLLPAHIRSVLQAHVGDAAHLMRVHDDDDADRVAQRHHADAVSIGPDVFFAQGRYQPNDARGVALLAHEAVHVAHATQPNVAWQRSGSHASRVEEATANSVERVVLRDRAVFPSGRGVTPTGPRMHPVITRGEPANPAASVPAQRPMAAAVDRSHDSPDSSVSRIDTEQMRQSLMRDLMHQIRVDMERGG